MRMESKAYVEREEWWGQLELIIQSAVSEDGKIHQICKLADSYYDQQDWDIALKILLKTFEMDAIYAMVIFRIGLVCERKKAYKQAIYWYESMLKVDKRVYKVPQGEEHFWSCRPLIQLSVCYYQIGDIDKSYNYHVKSKRLSPNDEFIRQNTAFFKSIGLGLFEKDIKDIQEVRTLLESSNPQTVLEVSNEEREYGDLIRGALLADEGFKLKRLDKVCLEGKKMQPEEDLYNRIYSKEILEQITDLPQYDMVVLPNVLNHLEDKKIEVFISKLLRKVNQSLLIIEPLTTNGIRRFHPTYFKDYDFSYVRAEYEDETIQCFNIFPTSIKQLKIMPPHLEIKDDKSSLKIGYLIPNGGLTGGTKCLLEQARQLQHKGYEISFYKYGNKAEPVMPNWCDLVEKRDFEKAVILEGDERLEDYTKDIDILVVGWMLLLPYTYNVHKPIILWEQGSCEIYGDYTGLITSQNSYKKQLEGLYQIPDYLFSVAPIVAHILARKYGRDSYVLTTGIDTEFYKPLTNKIHGKTILLVGNPYLSFKGFNFAMDVLEALWEKRKDFNVKWVCQGRPRIKESSFPIEYRVAPPQDVLVKYYQESDMFMSTSLYESFPMPPMEAMACGLPVVATNCGGIMSYAKSGDNCFIVEQEDKVKFIEHLEFLLDHVEARMKMGEKGRQTAMYYTYAKVVEQAENYILDVYESYKSL